MLTVISFKICPFVQRVTAALETAGIPYTVEYISLQDKPDWFLDISPHGQVPVLVTESGTALFESDAIVEYLDEVYGLYGPGPDAERKAQFRAWSYLATKNYLTQCSTQRSADRSTLMQRGEKLQRAFAAVEKVLDDQPLFQSATIGMVDIAWLPLLHRAAIIEQRSGYDFIAAYPAVKRWQRNLLATGLAERSVAADFNEAFSRFYLSADSWLGQQVAEHPPAACNDGGRAGCC